MNRKDDALVELTRVPSIAEANAIRHDLERAGIAATVFESDGGGWAPHFAIAEGHRVMIHAGDMSRAQEMVSHIGGQLEIDHSSPSVVIRKHPDRAVRRPESGADFRRSSDPAEQHQ